MKHPEVKSLPVFRHNVLSTLYSIVIPTYLRSRLLDETIKSALKTIEPIPDVNIVVVDNNPERGDETELMMEKYRNHKNITYYKNSENIGMVGNWNRCALLAETKYVILLHDDDLVEPDFMCYIERAITKIGDDKLAILKPRENRWKDEGYPYQFHQYNSKLKIEKIIAIENYNGFPIGAPTGCLLNRDIVIRTGGFDENYNVAAADVDYFIRLNLAYRCYKIKIPLVVYRISANESLKVEIQYLGYELCYRLIKSLVYYYNIPGWLFDRYWSKYSEGWAIWIRDQFGIDFNVEEAYQRIGLKRYGRLEKTIIEKSLRWYVKLIILPLNGKLKIIDMETWSRTIRKWMKI